MLRAQPVASCRSCAAVRPGQLGAGSVQVVDYVAVAGLVQGPSEATGSSSCGCGWRASTCGFVSVCVCVCVCTYIDL